MRDELFNLSSCFICWNCSKKNERREISRLYGIGEAVFVGWAGLTRAHACNAVALLDRNVVLQGFDFEGFRLQRRNCRCGGSSSSDRRNNWNLVCQGSTTN
jgi:hypothetical protein